MKICAMDLETTSLSALRGRVLCGSIFPIYNAPPHAIKKKAKAITFRGDTKKYREEDILDDGPLLTALRKELEKYHMIVTWNGKLFDVPFMNARLAKHGLPLYQPQMHLDLMYYAAGCSLRVGSRKLVNVQKYFGLNTAKTEISWEVWQRAASMNRNDMNEVVTHCEADVEVLAEAYHKMIPIVRNIHR